jgi:hypothetical protein
MKIRLESNVILMIPMLSFSRQTRRHILYDLFERLSPGDHILAELSPQQGSSCSSLTRTCVMGVTSASVLTETKLWTNLHNAQRRLVYPFPLWFRPGKRPAP